MKRLGNIIGACAAALSIILCVSVLSYSAITQVAGLAVAGANQGAWSNLKDAGQFSDPQTTGIGSVALWGYTGVGSNFERIRGTAAGGLSISQVTSGSAFFAVKRDNIAAASVNLAFGFTSKKVALEFPLTNTDEVCLDWTGSTAVCPAANTAGDDRFAPGDTIILDDYAVTSLSVIAASGTQTVYVRAWN